MSTSEDARESRRIVLARCVSVDVRKDLGGNIFTFSVFTVLRNVKGEGSASHFTLRLIGGRIGGVETRAEGIPQFTPNEEVVLFLGPENQDGYPIVFSEEVFRVRIESTSGAKTVQPVPSGLPLYRAANRTPYDSKPDALPLEDFVYSLSKLTDDRRNLK